MKSLFRCLPLLALATVLTGCGGDKRAVVTGKVTVAGKGPLPGGNIRFVSLADPNRTGGGLIKPDGTFEVPDAPVGECKVIIDNTHLDPNANKAGNMPGMPGPGAAGMPGPPGIKGGPGISAPGAGGPPKDAEKKMAGPPKGADVPSEMATKSELSGQKYVKLDPAFTKGDSTTLKAEVKSGSNTLNFEVK